MNKFTRVPFLFFLLVSMIVGLEGFAVEAPGRANLTASPDPVLFVHGLGGSHLDFEGLQTHLVGRGWPRARLFARNFESPSWGCNVANARQIEVWVEEIRAATGAERIDLVAHSMGGLSGRAYLKNLGGTSRVGTFVSVGTMHHGLALPCRSPLGVCVWEEMCRRGAFVETLSRPPVTPGPTQWVSIYSTDDETVPAEGSFLEGAENIEFHDLAHDGPRGLLEAPEVMLEIERVLLYP